MKNSFTTNLSPPRKEIWSNQNVTLAQGTKTRFTCSGLKICSPPSCLHAMALRCGKRSPPSTGEAKRDPNPQRSGQNACCKLKWSPQNIYSISLPNDKQQQVKSLCSRKVLDDWNTHNAVLHFIHSYNMCLDTLCFPKSWESIRSWVLPVWKSQILERPKPTRSNLALTRKDSEDANQSTQAFRGSRQFSFQLHPAPQSQRLYPTGPALGRVATWCCPRPLFPTCCWIGFPGFPCG